MVSPRVEYGAPGIYRVPPTTAPLLTGERLDICAFVGVAPRGPAFVPIVDERWREDQPTVGPGRPRRRSVAVPVASWAEYCRVFGGLAGPGRLPWAVRCFFEQGGREAWVVRIIAPVELDASGRPIGPAQAELAPLLGAGDKPVRLIARDEGVWANGMQVAVSFVRTPLVLEPGFESPPSFAVGEAPLLGTLLRGTFEDPSKPPELRFVTGLAVIGASTRERRIEMALSAAWSAEPERIEQIEVELRIHDEVHRCGLSPLHPRWLATVLSHESGLAWPDESWVDSPLTPVQELLGVATPTRFVDGVDRYEEIEVEHFFDDDWDPRSDLAGDGIAALADADAAAVASVVVPDLYHPQSLIPEELPEAEDFGSEDWETCLERETIETEPQPAALVGLVRDVEVQLDEIVASQRKVVALAEELRIVALLDVPPGLDQRGILRWRQQQSPSSWAAAYHPWLRLAPSSDEPEREVLVRLGPAAAAAGIIARREIEFGVPHGPANELAFGVVDVEDRVSPARHDQLHPRAINVFLRERDGVRLSAARTLSGDPYLRQLSVRRLLQLLQRTLDRQLQWAVFEPNDARLRLRLRDLLRGLLRELFRQGAFRGAREDEAFFVRCDVSNNPSVAVERGELLAEIGVAPAEPLEFIVLAVTRDGDGRLEVESR